MRATTPKYELRSSGATLAFASGPGEGENGRGVGKHIRQRQPPSTIAESHPSTKQPTMEEAATWQVECKDTHMPGGLDLTLPNAEPAQPKVTPVV
jgi:hypothetical protein